MSPSRTSRLSGVAGAADGSLVRLSTSVSLTAGCPLDWRKFAAAPKRSAPFLGLGRTLRRRPLAVGPVGSLSGTRHARARRAGVRSRRRESGFLGGGLGAGWRFGLVGGRLALRWPHRAL